MAKRTWWRASVTVAGLLGGLVGAPLARAEHAPPVGDGALSSTTGSFAPLIERLRPAVVNVQAASRRRGGEAMDEFFQRFFGGRGGGGDDDSGHHSLGSGFIIEASGYVITNLHVVKDGDDVRVKLADEREYRGEVVGRDGKSDLALIRIHGAPHDLPTVTLGTSDQLRVGDWVVAIGNPFGLGSTVTAGIVSAKERVVGAGPYDDFIQTDASINPGNSGGPLFNLAGEVVGVNTAMVAGGQGIGFAIPVEMVRVVAEQLRKSGKVTRGFIGIGVQDVTVELARAFRLPSPAGALVGSTVAGGPAQRAGVRPGDVIVEWNGRPIVGANRLMLLVAQTPPGARARITVLREGRKVLSEVRVGRLEDDDGDSASDHAVAPSPRRSREAGLDLRSLTPELARRSHLDGHRGALVAAIDPDAPTAGLLEEGDLIVEVDRAPVSDAHEARQRIAGGHGIVLLRVKRKDALLFVALPED